MLKPVLYSKYQSLGPLLKDITDRLNDLIMESNTREVHQAESHLSPHAMEKRNQLDTMWDELDEELIKYLTEQTV